MKNIIGVVLCVVAMATFVYSCSEPEGGIKELTPSEIVQYAEHVVVGEITEIIRPDPAFTDNMYGNSTYGAMVNVYCTYKGGELPKTIKIGAAGFVPGMCYSKDLELGKEYVMFLYDKNTELDLFEQSEVPVLKTKLVDFLRVCGLSLAYPKDIDNSMPRRDCDAVIPSQSCKDAQQNADPNTGEPNKPLSGNPPKAQGTDDENTASMVTTSSVSAILFTCLCYMML